MGTRTYVRYFDLDDVAELRLTLARIESDLERRSKHIDADGLEAARARIAIVKNGLCLMEEPVAEGLGG